MTQPFDPRGRKINPESFAKELAEQLAASPPPGKGKGRRQAPKRKTSVPGRAWLGKGLTGLAITAICIGTGLAIATAVVWLTGTLSGSAEAAGPEPSFPGQAPQSSQPAETTPSDSASAPQVGSTTTSVATPVTTGSGGGRNPFPFVTFPTSTTSTTTTTTPATTSPTGPPTTPVATTNPPAPTTTAPAPTTTTPTTTTTTTTLPPTTTVPDTTTLPPTTTVPATTTLPPTTTVCFPPPQCPPDPGDPDDPDSTPQSAETGGLLALAAILALGLTSGAVLGHHPEDV